MTSNDSQQYLTVELFRAEMDTLKAQIQIENEKLRAELKSEIQGVRTDLHSEIQGIRSELKAEIQDVRAISLVNSAKIDMLQHTFYWGFAIMTVVIAIVAVIVPYFLLNRKEKQQEHKQTVLTEQRVQDIVAQALSNLHSGGKTAM